MSRAITDLLAEFRWVLTGLDIPAHSSPYTLIHSYRTPIVNSLSDVYGYIRFLKIRPWYDWAKFHNDVGKLEKKQGKLTDILIYTMVLTSIFLQLRWLLRACRKSW